MNSIPLSEDTESSISVDKPTSAKEYMKIWEFLSLILLFLYLLETLGLSQTKNFCMIIDVMFLIDVIFRYVFIPTNIKGSEKNQLISISTAWFVLDIFLSIPYGTLFLFWEKLPAFRLLHIKNSRKPILNFITKRKFRQEVFRTIREHFTQKKAINNILAQLLADTTQKKRRIVSAIRKMGRIAIGLTRIRSNFKKLSFYLTTSRQLSWLLLSLRGLSVVLARSSLTSLSSSSSEETVKQS
jgi:hypothetical protein